jgi:hypothetical protein
MASSRGAIFLASMEDYLTNPVDIYFDLMLTESTAPATCLIIENTVANSFQLVESDLLTETHPPTPHVESMLSDTIKVCERVKRSSRTVVPPLHMPLGLRNSARAVSDHMKKKIQIQSGSTTTSLWKSQRSSRRPLPCPQV